MKRRVVVFVSKRERVFVDYKVAFVESPHVSSRSSEFIDMPACNKHRKSRDSRVIWPRTLVLSSVIPASYYILHICTIALNSVPHLRFQEDMLLG